MVIKLTSFLVSMFLLGVLSRWAFFPGRHLPGNRVRYLRVRLHLRLHPGKGFAPVVSLWLRWAGWPGYVAQGGFARRLGCLTACSMHASIRCFWAAPITGMGCMCR